MSNPLLAWQNNFSTFDDAVPFDQIETSHFLPAVEETYQKALQQIERIEKNQELPTFLNTIEAIEVASEHFEFVTGIYFNLFSAEASQELQALASHISPKSAELSSRILLSDSLFKRVQTVYEEKEKLNLSPEESKLLEKTYKSFVRNGALLTPEQKEELRQIDQELAKLSPKFSENVLKATNQYQLVITDANDLEGLPETVLEAAREEAAKKGLHNAWIFTLQIPSYLPFMKYSKKRNLREQMWKAYSSRATSGELKNTEIILNIVRLREKRAHLLGFKNHAEFVLQERMAKRSESVFQFLNQLLEPSRRAAVKELQELQAFAKKTDGLELLKPWDVPYYSERLKEINYAFNEETLRPYFKLENVIQGVFEHARRLYQLEFKERTDIPKYHPDVVTYEVRDVSQNEYIGLFYADFFPRETKQGGAWMTTFREQGLTKGEVKRPHVAIVCNFTKPTQTKPSLLTLDEVKTLFHEFGHALHGMLSHCRYKSLSGTNVMWDFVELPSQIMENWIGEKESLDIFARHYETNELIPEELIKKLKASQNFQSGMMSLRQLNFALLDMKWHTTSACQIKDVFDFEIQNTQSTRLFEPVPGTNTSCSFSHIFAGGYSAGYYSYKWAEVLDADAFELFLEKGIFNTEVAKKFREHILSQGGLEDPEVLYQRFRGRAPDPNALLKREGLLET